MIRTVLNRPPVERPHADGAADGGEEVEEELSPRRHRSEVQRVRQQQERKQVTERERNIVQSTSLIVTLVILIHF